MECLDHVREFLQQAHAKVEGEFGVNLTNDVVYYGTTTASKDDTSAVWNVYLAKQNPYREATLVVLRRVINGRKS